MKRSLPEAHLTRNPCLDSHSCFSAAASVLQKWQRHLRRFRSPAWREARDFYIFISPWIVGLVLFGLGPMLASLVISLTDWSLLKSPVFVGPANYIRMFTDDPLFWQALKVTSLYSLSVPLRMVLALAVAILLNQNVKGLTFFRTVYYLPSVVSGVAVAVLWTWLLNPDMGLVNYVLSLVGIGGPRWLFSETWVIPAFIIMSLWGVGGGIVTYLAGLQGIPAVYYEASEIDGAGSWRRFLYITLPFMSPVILFNLVMGIIQSFQVFASAYVMTAGGPNNASLFYVLYLYRHGFQFFHMGYACALAWILFIIISLANVAVFKSSTLWLFYESEAGR